MRVGAAGGGDMGREACWVAAMTLRFLALAALLAAPLPAKTLIVNANGYTMTAGGDLKQFTGLLVGDDGKVSALLARGDPEPVLTGVDFRLDAGGRTLLPGLIDAHGHVLSLGHRALSIDLSATTGLEEALEKIRVYAAANPRARWIQGGGWNQVAWKLGRFPTAAELDRAVSDRPVLSSRVDGHALWGNSLAIKASGITAKTRDPVGGRIERGAGSAASGVFVDAAQDLISGVAPPPSGAEAEAALAKALEIMASVGLTGVGDAGVSPEDWTLYRSFGDSGRLTARIYALAGGMEALDRIAPVRPLPWLYGDRLTLQGVKLYADGALGSRGAWLKAPYSDDPTNRGLQFHAEAKLQNWISRASFAGFQVAVHAIGDAANKQVLEAFALNEPTYGKTLRHRIEHAQVVSPDDLPQFEKLGIIASVQPTHATSDKAMAADRVGEARLAGAYAWKSLVASGAKLALGSDFPVESPNPFFGLHAAITRQDQANQPDGGWRAQEALTRVQAFAGFTSGAAYAMRMEDRTGTLEPGKWADFILIDRDIFTSPAQDVWKTTVDETWLAGRRIYVRQP